MIERLIPCLVTTIPASPEPGLLYVSVEYATTLHLCACGCGHEVVLGISPNDWNVLWDGETVTLDPSVGNWNFPCQSHYLVRLNRIVHAGQWSDEQIARGRARDAGRHAAAPVRLQQTPSVDAIDVHQGMISRLVRRLGRLRRVL
jgi:hypothetical protein